MDHEIPEQKLKRIRDEVYNCIIKECKEDLMGILKQTDNASSYAVLISFGTLNFMCPTTFDTLLWSPQIVFKQADKAATEAQLQVYEEERDQHRDLSLKINLRVRLRAGSLNASSPLYKHKFPDCSASGQYIVLVGSVTTARSVQAVQFRKPYRCNKCKRIMKYEAPASRFYRYPPDTILKCETCCVNTTFKLVSIKEVEQLSVNTDLRDYQEIKVQENLNGFQGAIHSKVYTVILEEDLVNTCSPGDQVYIGGWIFNRFKAFKQGARMEGQTVFQANHVAVTNLDQRECLPTQEQIEDFESFWRIHKNNPLLGRDRLLRSFCPEIIGMYPVKLALLVAILGGVDSTSDEMKMRSQSHVLLMGDPGVAKSQLLRYCSKLIPRSVCTTGYGSTAAGLTVGATKVGKEWELEAGALVIAGSGLCCIDEFTLLKEDERNAILEAMEQQTISVAKAGIMCKLNVHCTVFGAANPKSITKRADNGYDVDTGIKSPLLSRFDVAMLLVDERNPEFDESFADFVLGLKPCMPSERPEWDTEKLKTYIAYVKKFVVEISDDASQVLSKYYIYQRRTQKDRSVIVTPRFLESLMRLTQGHAKLMNRKRATVFDAIASLTIMEFSLYATNILGINSNSVSLVSFPDDVIKDYRDNAKQFLNFLDLNSIWRKEEEWLSTITSVSDQIPDGDCSNVTSFRQATQGVTSSRTEDDDQERYNWFHESSNERVQVFNEHSDSSIEVVQASFPVSSNELSEIGATSQEFGKKST